MLLPDHDRYYTPTPVARLLVEAAGSTSIGTCFDSACGDGSLLLAAEDLLRPRVCVGLDLDRAGVARLSRRHPGWILSVGDALLPGSWSRTRARAAVDGCDLALLNPPFSMAAKKGVRVAAIERGLHCSVAMAHILLALFRTNAARCAAIVPDSLLYSDLDARARDLLHVHYALDEVVRLASSTFRGARPNATVVRLVRRRRPAKLTPLRAHSAGMPDGVTLVRGGLPTFEAEVSHRGVPYIHSTEIPLLGSRCERAALRRVLPIGRGLVSGDVVLLPRVGKPAREHMRAYRLSDHVQLSDCVIALCFDSRERAHAWARTLSGPAWTGLQNLYRGTGAPYVTVSRIANFLAALRD